MQKEDLLGSVERMIDGLPLDKAEAVLRPMVENGIITYENYKQTLSNMKRKTIISEHPFTISQHKDGRWRTYVITPSGKKRQLVRTTRKKLEDDIIANYDQCGLGVVEEDVPTFWDCYQNWRELHDQKVSQNTISKYDTDARRYFEGEAFVDREIHMITGDDVERFIFKKIKELNLCRDAVKFLLCYVKSVFHSACRNRIIKEDVTRDITASIFYHQCKETSKPEDVLLVPDKDWAALYEKFLEDFEKHPTYMAPYAIVLAAYTGMRVGELAVLKWEDIRKDPFSGITYLGINRSEVYVPAEKKYYIVDFTKNHKNRVYPVTP